RREERGEPPSVATRRPEAGDLTFEQHDVEVRLLAEQVVSGPQTGEAGPDDRDVRLAVAIEWATSWADQVGRQRVPPQRLRGHRRHGRTWSGTSCGVVRSGASTGSRKTSRIGMTPAQTGRPRSSGLSSGGPSLTLTEASSRLSASTFVAASSFLL